MLKSSKYPRDNSMYVEATVDEYLARIYHIISFPIVYMNYTLMYQGELNR